MTKTKTQKLRAKQAQGKQGRPKAASSGRKDARWHLGFNNFSMGSGDGRAPGVKQRNLQRMAPESSARMGSNYSKPRREAPIRLDRDANVIEQDEVITSINGSTSFDSQIISINPGQLDVFAWAGQLAKLYERYKFDYLEFYYKPWVSGYAADGSAGKVILSADYDSATGLLQTYQQAESMDPHADGMPYDVISLKLDPSRLTPDVGKFVRTGIVPAGTDIKTYDAGALFVCVKGTTGTSAIGELRVKYKVRLLNPRLPNTVPANVNFNSSTFYTAVATSVPTNAWTQVDFDTVASAGNGLSITNVGGLFTVHSGHYKVGLQGYLIKAATADITLAGIQCKKNGILVGDLTPVNVPTTTATLTYIQSLTQEVTAVEGDTIAWEVYTQFGASTCGWVGTVAWSLL